MSTVLAGIITITPQEGSIPAIVIPVNPPVEDVTGGIEYHEQQMLNGRNLGKRGNIKLRRLWWTSFFPANLNAPYVNPDLGYTPAIPQDWVRLFDGINRAKIICYLSIPGLNVNGEWVLEDFDWSLEGGNGDALDIQYTMNWAEYVRISLETAQQIFEPRSSSASAPKTGTRYTIVAGDTLWAIAKRFYGNGSLWTVIWDANKPMSSGSPSLIYPGETIYVPNL